MQYSFLSLFVSIPIYSIILIIITNTIYANGYINIKYTAKIE